MICYGSPFVQQKNKQTEKHPALISVQTVELGQKHASR